MVFSFIIFLIPLALAAALIILHRWRAGIFFVFAWLFFGDTVRKLVPDQPQGLILVGDALLLLTYISFFAWAVIKKKRLWTPPFFLSLFFLAAVAVLNVFHPASPGFIIGLVGIRSYLWFVPLAWLGYHLFRDENGIIRFFRVLAFLAILFFLFAILQAVLFRSHIQILRPFETGHQVHSFGGGKSGGPIPKIPSFFGSDQRYASASLLWFLSALGLFAGSKKGERLRKWYLAAFLAGFGGIILSASRSVFVLAALGIVLFFAFLNRKRFREGTARIFSRIRPRHILFFLTVLFVILVFLNQIGIEIGLYQVGSFYELVTRRIPVLAHEMQLTFSRLTLFGYGTGTRSQGLDALDVGKQLIASYELTGEGETGIRKVLFELGFVGLLIFYYFWVSLAIRMFRRVGRLRDAPFLHLALGIALFVFLILIRFTFVHHQVLGDAAVLASLWFSIGAFFKLEETNEARNRS